MQERISRWRKASRELEDGIAECEQQLQSFVSAEETQRQTDLLTQHRAELATRMEEGSNWPTPWKWAARTNT